MSNLCVQYTIPSPTPYSPTKRGVIWHDTVRRSGEEVVKPIIANKPLLYIGITANRGGGVVKRGLKVGVVFAYMTVLKGGGVVCNG